MIYLGVNKFPAGCRDGKAECSAQTENQLFASATVRCAEPERAAVCDIRSEQCVSWRQDGAAAGRQLRKLDIGYRAELTQRCRYSKQWPLRRPSRCPNHSKSPSPGAVVRAGPGGPESEDSK